MIAKGWLHSESSGVDTILRQTLQIWHMQPVWSMPAVQSGTAQAVS